MKRILMLEKESDQITVLLAESAETAAMQFIAEHFGEDVEDSGIDFVMAIVGDLDVMFGEMPEDNEHVDMESASFLVDRKSLLEFLSLDEDEEEEPEQHSRALPEGWGITPTVDDTVQSLTKNKKP